MRWFAGLIATLLFHGICCAAGLTDYHFHDILISTCQADLQQDTARMYWKDGSKQLLGRFPHLQTWLRSQGEDLVCAMNAGIYDQDFRPHGLYIENGVTFRQLNVRKNAYGNFYMQPNGVFLIRNQGTEKRAEIVDTDRFAANIDNVTQGVAFATQSGPLLIQAGVINIAFSSTSPNLLVRNAVCLRSSHNIILALARNPISFYDFAQFLKGLGCTDALYLDGSISRMYPSVDADFGPDFGAMIAVTKKYVKK